MIKNRHFNLAKIIYNDLCLHGKIQLCLLLLIIISAIIIIWVTHQSRWLIVNREVFLLQKNILEYEWNNLILEKEILSNYLRIEDIALNKLHMCYVDSELRDIQRN